jgi:ribosome biogenesis GTPase / thiamine phosphate phosphatase
LALVEEAGAHPVIVVTKIDLAVDRTSFMEQAANIRANLDVVAVNARDPESVNVLNPWLYKGKTIALMGSSGVGKSSLINTLLGQDLYKTSAVREQDSKGRHTTSARSMSMLTTQTWLIDTPGMREIQMMDTSGVEGVFDDIEQLALHCRFTNCAHDSEKDCAVQAAIASTELDVARFERFKKMKSENDSLSHFGTKSHSRRRKKT